MSPRRRLVADTADDHPSPSVAIVQAAIQQLGLRQVQLAQQIGLTKDHLSRILLGKVAFPTSRDTLRALAQALKLDPVTFREYREQIRILPESTRRLVAHLRSTGLSEQLFIQRVHGYSEGHLHLLLRGGTVFPKDPVGIERLAAAAGCSPYLFEEYVPLSDWHLRLTGLAAACLRPEQARQFEEMLQQMQAHIRSLAGAEMPFEARLLRHWLMRQFAGGEAEADDSVFADALAYFPPWDAYQPVVRAVLRGLYDRGEGLEAVAAATGADLSELYAIANGQITLEPGALQDSLLHYLQVTPEAIATDTEGRV